MVEAPGTAPGSDRFITQAFYRHSRSDRRYEYKRNSGKIQSVRAMLRYRVLTEAQAENRWFKNGRPDVNGILSPHCLIIGPVNHGP